MQKVKKVSKKSSLLCFGRFVLGGLILVMLLTQLFTFEKFPAELGSVLRDDRLSVTVAISLVLCELWALPNLFNMKLSSKLLAISKWAGVMSLASLAVLEILSLINDGQSIIFGATF